MEYENLIDLITATSDSIRFKEGTSASIPTQEIPERIKKLNGGGSNIRDKEKVTVIGLAGTHEGSADYLADALNSEIVLENVIKNIGGKIVFLEGVYTFANPITIQASNFHIVGVNDAKGATTVFNIKSNFIYIDNVDYEISDIIFENISIVLDTPNANATQISFISTGIGGNKVGNITIKGCNFGFNKTVYPNILSLKKYIGALTFADNYINFSGSATKTSIPFELSIINIKAKVDSAIIDNNKSDFSSSSMLDTLYAATFILIDAQAQIKKCSITNNDAEGNNFMKYLVIGGSSSATVLVKIADNRLLNFCSTIYVYGSSCDIINNTIKGDYNSKFFTFKTIDLQYPASSKIIGNTIESKSSAIATMSLTDSIISNNVISVISGVESGKGIFLQQGRRNVVSSNFIYVKAASGIAIDLYHCSNALISSNILYGKDLGGGDDSNTKVNNKFIAI